MLANNYEVHTQLLTKRALDEQRVDRYDAALLIHKDESRLLLFNENGLYNHLFGAMWRSTHGNAILILESANKYDIPQLSKTSQQPLLGLLWKHERVL